jgi:hypothetical protein
VRHAQGDLNAARVLYQRSIDADDHVPLAHYGMAQTLVAVVRFGPWSVQALLLGACAAHMQHEAQAIEALTAD